MPRGLRTTTLAVINLNIGFFQNFKGSDSVLLECTAKEIVDISNQLENYLNLVKSWQFTKWRQYLNATQLNYSHFFPRTTQASKNSAFYRLCAGDELTVVKDKLKSLSSFGIGHQYFSVVGSLLS